MLQLTRPEVSIIIPTYNSELTIQRCLLSVVSQTIKNFEILVKDGMSSDNTVSIVKELKDQNPLIPITIISEKDKGVYDAMNQAIELSSGEWLYFLGSDDYLIDENVLRDVSPYLHIGDLDLVYGNVIAPDYGGVYGGVFTKERIVNENICHQAIFYNRSLFRRYNNYSLEYPLLSDYEFNLKCLFDRKVTTKHINRVIAHYSSNGLSKRVIDAKFLSDKDRMIFRLQFFNGNLWDKSRLLARAIRNWSNRTFNL